MPSHCSFVIQTELSSRELEIHYSSSERVWVIRVWVDLVIIYSNVLMIDGGIDEDNEETKKKERRERDREISWYLEDSELEFKIYWNPDGKKKVEKMREARESFWKT